MTAALSTNPGNDWDVFATPSDRDAVQVSVGAQGTVSKGTTVDGKLNAEAGNRTHDYRMRSHERSRVVRLSGCSSRKFLTDQGRGAVQTGENAWVL
ncbi:hypothetical protein [Cupriavidus sp. IDO]|uniref:hypothetical protein n=1 Tax=Cupriavidus sp. IDO TaxID=1539142 RepID=UPI00057971FF|nr:hypothetical protein [Cupriavidus sp. IDO]KWR83382.1 hypothetical protein RM96_28380 [Cupriavidus sp. IDO]